MRRPVRTLLAVFPAIWALGALAGGCSVSAPPTAAPATMGSVHPYDGGAADATAAAEDAGTDAAPQGAFGSLLCVPVNEAGVPSVTACDPDNSNPYLCPLPDGGVLDPLEGGAGQTCRVVPTNANSTTAQGTACSATGTGQDGASCTSAAECAAGYDCVGTPGKCQHYCCSGSDACDKKQFCDIQSLTVATNTHVPVCMPIESCTLTPDGGGCPNASQTCAIVRDDGTTSCVEIGSRTAGESCDTEHCAAGLVCLGSASAASGTPESRVCYQLCSTTAMTGAYACTESETCQGGLPLFQDPSVGICR